MWLLRATQTPDPVLLCSATSCKLNFNMQSEQVLFFPALSLSLCLWSNNAPNVSAPQHPTPNQPPSVDRSIICHHAVLHICPTKDIVCIATHYRSTVSPRLMLHLIRYLDGQKTQAQETVLSHPARYVSF